MKSIQAAIYFLSLVGLVGMSGCAKYSAQPLQPLQTAVPGKTTPYVSMAYKTFTDDDSIIYLGRDTIERGYQPVQIAVGNHSNHRISVSTKDIDLPSIPAKVAANRAHFSTIARTCGYLAAGPVVWFGSTIILSALTAVITGCNHSINILVLVFGTLATPLSLIPGIIEGFNLFRANREMDKDYAQKELRDCLLTPSQITQGIIFVPIHQFKPEFSCMVTDEETKTSYKLSTDNPCVDIS